MESKVIMHFLHEISKEKQGQYLEFTTGKHRKKILLFYSLVLSLQTMVLSQLPDAVDSFNASYTCRAPRLTTSSRGPGECTIWLLSPGYMVLSSNVY